MIHCINDSGNHDILHFSFYTFQNNIFICQKYSLKNVKYFLYHTKDAEIMNKCFNCRCLLET